MGDAINSRKEKVLQEYTKLPDSESNSATVLVDTHGVIVFELARLPTEYDSDRRNTGTSVV